MSPWARARGDSVVCGGCGEPIAAGAPVYYIVVALGQRLTHPLVRCEACEGAAPPDLPALPARVAPEPVTWTPVARVAVDWRARAAGREPGEDDA